MATMKDMCGQMIEKLTALAAENAMPKDWQTRHRGCVEKMEQKLAQVRDHREQTALRNQALQIWKDHFEQQSLAARKVVGEALLSG